jgi:hypothetical protein
VPTSSGDAASSVCHATSERERSITVAVPYYILLAPFWVLYLLVESVRGARS